MTGVEDMIWSNLLHLSVNMWEDTPPKFAEELRFDEALWNELTEKMAEVGFNQVVIDLGDAIRYRSHPEIAVQGAWKVERLEQELARLRHLGLEPIPKLNFSATHDAWLGLYSRQVSTPIYYQVCTDLINEVSDIFDTPRFFHLGMDEENATQQHRVQYAVMRRGDLWWHDLELLADAVRGTGSTPWIWADHAWPLGAEYYERMPHDIIQSAWYYGHTFPGDESGRPRVLTGSPDRWMSFLDLDDYGFLQIPTGSNHADPRDFGAIVDLCLERVDHSRILGFLQTPWRFTIPESRDHHLEAIENVRVARIQALERFSEVATHEGVKQ